MAEITNAVIEATRSRLTEKRAALHNSDSAINTLTDLLVAAANGEAVTESGARLSMSDVVKGADALRQVHAMLTTEVVDLEKRLEAEIRKVESARFSERLKVTAARACADVAGQRSSH